MWIRPLVALVLVLAAAPWPCAPAHAGARRLRVLVTNDDGVAAPGLDALVTALASNPNLTLTVIAPATNQSGTGDTITTTPVSITPATTASGHPATAVGGKPADCVLFAIRHQLAFTTHLLVSGINAGQNIADAVPLSGTVGAARTAARLGIPAIAASQGLGTSIDYARQAAYVARLVETFRKDREFRRRMFLARGRTQIGVVLNVNFPTCATGAVRGIRLVPTGRLLDVSGYMLSDDTAGVKTYQPAVVTGDFVRSDCASTLQGPRTDLEAFNNGFASVSPLAPDFSVVGDSRAFRLVERER